MTLVCAGRVPLSATRVSRLAFPTQLRSFSASPANSAPYQYTTLPERAVLAITNKDSPKFLQGLITNDVNRIVKPKDGEEPVKALYAAMLKADGRILHDIFIFPAPSTSDPPTPTFLLDHPASISATLRTYLKRHILRTKVSLAREADHTKRVFAAWRTKDDASADEAAAAEEWLRSRDVGEDTRAPGMGWRWAGAVEGDHVDLPPPDLFASSSPAHFHLHRLLHAVPEGPSDFAQLPLEANVDLMGAVDYKKGCYVGQELTARTHHKGVVRKRGVAFRLFREGEDVPTSLEPAPSPLIPFPNLFPLPPPRSSLTLLNAASPRARPSGKLGSSLPVVTKAGTSSALAFGTVRLEHLVAGDGVFVVKPPPPGEEGAGELEGEAGMGMEGEEEGGRWLAKAFMTDWVAEKLNEEAQRKAAP